MARKKNRGNLTRLGHPIPEPRPRGPSPDEVAVWNEVKRSIIERSEVRRSWDGNSWSPECAIIELKGLLELFSKCSHDDQREYLFGAMDEIGLPVLASIARALPGAIASRERYRRGATDSGNSAEVVTISKAALAKCLGVSGGTLRQRVDTKQVKVLEKSKTAKVVRVDLQQFEIKERTAIRLRLKMPVE